MSKRAARVKGGSKGLGSSVVMSQADVGRLDKVLTAKQGHLETIQKDQAVLEQRIAAEADQSLLEKVRENGVIVTIAEEQINRQLWTPDQKRAFLDRVRALPKRYGVRLAQPSGMPTVRRMMLNHLEWEAHMGAGIGPLPIAPERDWQMFFATADFASLFAEMQRDFKHEQMDDYLSDIMEEWGTSGQIVVGFDLNRLPVARTSKTFNSSTDDVSVPPDPYDLRMPDDPEFDRLTLAAVCFQWKTDETGATAFTGGVRTPYDTFRSTGPGSPTSRDVMLIVWMLASRQLRMLESTTRKAQAGLPPKAKGKRTLREETVTVVSLRRHVAAQVEEVQHAESGRSLTHRFVVRGHWRNQAYGANRALRRRMYILPYVKGPQDAPFIDREKVYQW